MNFRVIGTDWEAVYASSIFIIRSKAAYQKSRVKMQKADSALIVLDNYSGLDVTGLSIYSVINWKNSIKTNWNT